MQWQELSIGLVTGAGLTLGVFAIWWSRVGGPARLNGIANERRASLGNRLEALQHVIDSAGIGTFFWDVKRDTLRWSDDHYKIFHWPTSTPVTHAMFRQRVHIEDLAEVDAAIDAALRSGSDYAIRFRLRLDDGSVRYVRGSGRVKLDSDGRPACVNGAVIDVTEATHAQNAMRQRERDLAAVAVHLPDIISRFDRDFRCVFMSAPVAMLTGRPMEYYIGKKYSEFGMPSSLEAQWGAVLDNVLCNGEVREFDFSRFDQNGNERFFIARAFPSFDAEGRVESVLTVSSDHTERERSTRQLKEAGAELQRADLRKNEYLATLAHELRGPLAPISSAAQLIRFSGDRDVRDKARAIIERQVSQMAKLVDDLMEVGRISSGKLAIDKKLVTVQEVINQAVESTHPIFAQKKQMLTWVAPPTPIWVDGDSLRLTQVFTNLLTNASKYSPAGLPVSIEVRAEGSTVVAQVRDQGVGLSASSIREIFDLFVQVHATGVNSQGGLGIGLSLVKQLVELHGGSVTASSEGIGKGSCFTVILPRTDHRLPEIALLPNVQAVASSPITVLVVDDNVDGATTLALLLEAMGHTAVLAFNGRDAVALAAERPLDMVFLDLGLPDISGVQVALLIRNTPRGRKLPVFALTGLGREEDRSLTRAAQFNEHVTKPLRMEDLVRITQMVAAERTA